MKATLLLAALHATREGGTVAFAPPPPLSAKARAPSPLAMSRSGYSFGGGSDDSWDRSRSERRGGRSTSSVYDDRDYGYGRDRDYGYGRDGYLGRDDYYYNGAYNGPIFGNGNYYNDLGTSEDFRQVSRGDRYRRREDLRSPGRGRIQDYYTPAEREDRQQRQNRGARYGWQQQYDVERGNVRRGSSSDFRRGSAISRIQDFYTPREREVRQQRQNEGARYGWQQQYNMGRGNVRNSASSENFRRGSALARMQDVYTPREREMQQMRDNREQSRGIYGDSFGDREGSYGFERDGYGYGTDRISYGRDNSLFDSDRRRSSRDYDDYYEPEIVGYDSYGSGRERGGWRNAWDNFRNIFD